MSTQRNPEYKDGHEFRPSVKPEEVKNEEQEFDTDEKGVIIIYSQDLQPTTEQEKLLEEQISTELIKANLTDAIIAELKDRASKLKLKDLSDKEGYLEIVRTRKEAKKLRLLAKSICTKGREEALMIQARWVAAEQRVGGAFEEIEKPLSALEKQFEAEETRLKAQKKAREDGNLARRSIELIQMGAVLVGTEFISGDVVYAVALIRESDEDVYQELILPKYKAMFDAKQKIVQAAKEKADKEAAELKAGQEKLKQQQEELQEQLDKLKTANDNAAQAEKDRVEQEKKEKQQADKKKFLARFAKLQDVTFNGVDILYKGKAIISELEVLSFEDEDFEVAVKVHNDGVEKAKDDEKKLQQKKFTGRVRADICKSLGVENPNEEELSELPEEEWLIIQAAYRTAYDKKKHGEWLAAQKKINDDLVLKKQEELALATDKEKYKSLVAQLATIVFPEFKSATYKTKSKIIRDFIDDLK